jgi:hypothetical protein
VVNEIAAAGPPFSISRPDGGDLDIEAGLPIATKPLTGTGRIHGGTLPRSLTGTVSAMAARWADRRVAGPPTK